MTLLGGHVQEGLRLQSAIEKAWNRAWPSIRDSNLSTLITCGILFWFGSAFGASIVKGFAFTLAIGVLLSMFTAMVVSRVLMRTIVASQGEKALSSRILSGF